MKLSLNWIKDYVDLPESMDMSKFSYDLTMSTVEVEGTENLADRFKNMLLGEIKEVLPHPNADKLRVCRVDLGDDIYEIVCGGSNLEPGMKVAVAAPGSFCRWHGEGEPVEIKKSKLRGVESYGMICASTEIGLEGLFPLKDDHEIVDLSAFDFPAGTPLATALDMDDILIEIDNKSMTNRPDLWGHYGIARELAALYNLPLKEYAPFETEVAGNLEVEIEDSSRCSRYIGVSMDNVSVKSSPYKIQNRIWKAGMRPINALVDITNYVMLATGQPTHAFDQDTIVDHITVRRAKENETLELLNGKKLNLINDDLVIADGRGPIALAGVMGGCEDSILPTTNKVILEVANFEATGIRRTALRYENRTEASTRYEKALDPERCDLALSIAMDLFKELYPELKVTGYNDNYPEKLKKAELDVSVDWLIRRLGRSLTNDEIASQLGRLGFEVSFDGDKMHVIVPSWRSTGDVSIKADIMEEVARMIGYENFEPAPITTSFDAAINQLDIDLVRNVKEYLALRCGMQEIFTYPWMKDQYANALIGDLSNTMALSTPPAPDEKFIRSSLLPNICEAVAKNERYFDEFSIFEEAQVISSESFISKYDETEFLPKQTRTIAGAFVGNLKDVNSLFRTAKGVIEYMPRFTHMEGFTFVKEEKPVWADETVWLNIMRGDKKIGNLALLSKKTSMACDIKKVAVILFELDTTLFVPFTSRTNKFEHMPEFPIVDYDMSIIFDSNVSWKEIKEVLDKQVAKSPLLHSAEFIDEYHGKQIPDGKKSVMIRLRIGALDKTLTSQEIEKVANNALQALCKLLNASLRAQ
ncbi:MAG: phenylalanine--tRNA ligase subunit beta [Lachnospiraceae bacterium]|nr:phenylalanine--tRNA ligase subunit beta [Lachnospiraceae bacterium]